MRRFNPNPVPWILRHDRACCIGLTIFSAACLLFNLVTIAHKNWIIWWNGFSTGMVCWTLVTIWPAYLRRRSDWKTFNEEINHTIHTWTPKEAPETEEWE